MSRTLFENYGGFASVSKIVSAFYDKVLDSERLSRFFLKVDMRRLIDHQTKFIASIMGGPASFSDDALYRAHSNLGITKEDFDEAVELLIETLEDFDVTDEDVEHLRQIVLRAESLIVTPAMRPRAAG